MKNRIRAIGLTGCILILLFTSLTEVALAGPVFGKKYNLLQPDGTTVAVKIWGDEFYQVVESMEGYTLVRDPQTQQICYAELSKDKNELRSTGISANSTPSKQIKAKKHLRIKKTSAHAKIKKARQRFAKGEIETATALADKGPLPAPNIGNIKGICLIVDFPDEAGTIPPGNVDDFCNQVGYAGYGNNGSVRDYFYDISDGNLTYTNYVCPTYYTALHDKGYYDNPAEFAGPKARELIIEALNWLEASGFDFSQYDADNDGYIDGINCFYAGTVQSGWAMGLWPHSWTVSFSADGVSSYKYQITDMGTSLEIGTFCHENGHMICWWPDLYDYGFESEGAGYYCLMAAGSWGGGGKNPHEPCAYLKAEAGWASVTNLSTPQSNLSVTAGENSFYKFPHPTKTNEFYMVSNRQKTSRDTTMPDAGIAIWHIDTNGSNDNEQMTCGQHYLVTLVQADGDWDLENGNNYGDSTDLYDASSYNECSSFTYPNTDWWCDGTSDLNINSIGPSANTMFFNFGLINSPPIVSITATDSSAGEPSNNGSFTVSRNVNTSSSLRVYYSTTGSTATSGSDYTALAGYVDIPANQTTAAIPVTVINDSTQESPETVIVTLTSNAAYTIGSPSNATVTISDDDGGGSYPEGYYYKYETNYSGTFSAGPSSLAIDLGDNYIYFRNHDTVYQYGNNGTFLSSFSCPSDEGLAVDSYDAVYVPFYNTSTETATVNVYSKSGSTWSLLRSWNLSLPYNPTNNYGQSLAIAANNSSDTRIHVLCSDEFAGSVVQEFDRYGSLKGSWSPSGMLTPPCDMTYEYNNNLFYLLSYNWARVYKYNSSGSVLDWWGNTTGGSSADGEFDHPTGISVSPAVSSLVSVADSGNARVQVFTSSGTLYDIIDGGDMDFPESVCMSSGGERMFVWDAGNKTLRSYLWQSGSSGVTPQSIPYTQDFSSGKPGDSDGWEYYSDNEGQIEVASGQLRMDDTTDGSAYSLNEAILHLNLSGQSGVLLTLDHVDSSDEDTALPSTFTDHSDGDGIAISADGTNWYLLTNLTSSFTDESFDMDSAIQSAGISYTSDFQIKFQQYDNYSWSTDGRAFDNILVTGENIAAHVHMIEIDTVWDYNEPGVSNLTYDFYLGLETDDSVSLVEFETPTGHTFTIPNDASTQSGEVRTWHYADGDTHFWEYEGTFIDRNALADYGDGTYTITVHYEGGGQDQTEVWFGIPGEPNPIPQPIQEPNLTFPEYNGTTTSPVTFTWEPCMDANATSISLILVEESTEEEMWIEFPNDATSSDPCTLSPGIWDAQLCFDNLYAFNNVDGIPVEIGKYSKSDYRFTVTEPEDTDPPTPDPMSWSTEPYATGSSSISMTATTASDASGVEYYFECTAGGGNDSGWQDSSSNEDTGLSSDTQYTYCVKARDKSSNQNETGWSSSLTATTQSESTETIYEAEDAELSGAVPIRPGVQFGYTGTGFADYINLSGDSIKWTVNVATSGQYELQFRYALASGDRPLEIKVNGQVVESSLSFPATRSWSTWGTVSTTATLSSGQNTVRATAIGSSGGNVDHLKVIASVADTASPSPDPMTWATQPYATGSSSISMTATTATDDSSVEYYFECTAGGGNSSGWQDSSTYEDTGLSPDTQYTYRVKARDKSSNQNETSFSSTASATTNPVAVDTDAPIPDPMTWATQPYAIGSSSISMTATTASDDSGVEYYFEEVSGNSGGSDSGWQNSATYTDTGLSASTQYTYRIKARDKSSNQNETGWSSSLTATTQSESTETIYEAEDAELSGAVPIRPGVQFGYTGTGFADYINLSGDSIKWTVNVATSGQYELQFRYALASGDRPLEIKVNGQVVESSLSFPATRSWSTWGTVSTTATLSSGQNTVRATAIGSSGGNVDHLKMTDTSTP